jgi:hypothetical protein
VSIKLLNLSASILSFEKLAQKPHQKRALLEPSIPTETIESLEVASAEKNRDFLLGVRHVRSLGLRMFQKVEA